MFTPKVIGVGGIFFKPKNPVEFANTMNIWVLNWNHTTHRLNIEMPKTKTKFSISYGQDLKMIKIIFGFKKIMFNFRVENIEKTVVSCVK